MGKRSRSGKMDGKVVRKDYADRPGAEKQSSQKPKEKSKAKKAPIVEEEELESLVEIGNKIPVELQQLLLNIFKDTFPDILTSDTLQPVLQDVKTALYDRDFTRAFGKSEYLEAYSIRWSPSRALCYQSILVDLQDHLASIAQLNGNFPLEVRDPSSPSAEALKSSIGAVCFGGGAAEVIAFGGLIRSLQDVTSLSTTVDDDEPSITQGFHDISLHPKPTKYDLRLLDVAQWQDVVQKLHTGLTTPPTISKYANAAARESNVPLLTANQLSATFRAEDILEMNQKDLTDEFGQVLMLFTLLFTLNELYTASIGKTTAFLLNLTAAAKPGSLLLVVDSPGSYSETTVGTEAKKYPMQWLLNHTLLDSPNLKDESGDKTSPLWIKVESEDSKWFRIPEKLRYPIPLENMRYQLHLYRRV